MKYWLFVLFIVFSIFTDSPELRTPINPHCLTSNHSEFVSRTRNVINLILFINAESEEDSDGDQYRDPKSISKEEDDQLLHSDADSMEVDEESFHSAASAQGDHSPYGGQLALVRAFNAVRAAKLASMSARSLVSTGTTPLSPVGSLAEPSEGRGSRSFTISSFSKRRNIMSSFDLESLKCTTCPLKPGHIVLYREANEKLNMHHYPAVFIISDQSYPPNIPTGGEDCEG